MRDFTLDTLRLLLSSFKSAGYDLITVAGYLHNPSAPAVIVRHDVDARPQTSLKCAEMENLMGIAGTYYFRAVRGSYDESFIREIHSLGHEIGYHYEDLASAHGDYEKAIRLFEQNLAKLRHLVPIETICMHGSPLSRHDNRKLWGKYDYRNFGIIGEPYLDIDFREVLYMTDTGRRWDGEKYAIRDRVTQPDSGPDAGDESHAVKDHACRSTFEIIREASGGNLPSKIMITLHPQRWDNAVLPWLYELIWQNTKNVVKRFLTTF
jgi:hypothetical protein